MPVAAIIPAAGVGSRMGSPQPKQFLRVRGEAVLTWTLRAIAGEVDELVIVGSAIDDIRACLAAAGVRAGIVPGGATRQASVAAGLAAVARSDRVLVHDAVRPCVPAACIRACIRALDEVPACVLAVPCAATLKRADPVGRDVAATVDRRGLWLAQTPQGLHVAPARAAFARAAREGWDCTDDAEVMERAGHAVRIVPGDARNLKLTTPDELPLIACLLAGAG